MGWKFSIYVIFWYEIVLLCVKFLTPFIKYIINLFEMWTLSDFDSKSTIFTVIDFVSNCLCIIINIYVSLYIIYYSGYFPIYVIRDMIIYISMFIKACHSFYKTIQMTIKLKKLPIVKGKDLDVSNDVCLVCFMKIEKGRLIGCGHAYHYSCIKTWIEKNDRKECPKCRKKINLDEHAEISDKN